LARDLRNQTLNQLLLQSGVTLGVMVFIAALLGWLIAGRVVDPVKAMTEQARRMSERNLHERIAMAGPQDEMKDLADTFDAMLGRLDFAFDSQRRFVANASHELRTPLAISRAAVEVQMQRKRHSEAQWRAMADQVLASTARSERLINSLLLLARIEEGRHVREPVDLAQLLREVADEERPEQERAALKLEVSTEPAPVEGDPDLLRRLIGNLLENAVRYNVDGGWIRAEVAQRDGNVVLTVTNSGEKLTTQAASELFEPFIRGGSPRTRSAEGAGLGLSIVMSIANAHKGTVSSNSPRDGGLAVSVALPGTFELA
jgi:signal transduction histidine kinase